MRILFTLLSTQVLEVVMSIDSPPTEDIPLSLPMHCVNVQCFAMVLNFFFYYDIVPFTFVL